MSEQKSDVTGRKSPPAAQQQPLRRTRLASEKKIAEDEFMAAAIGDQEWLRQSLRGNRGVINYDKAGFAPIHLASIHGRIECLKLLVEKFKVDVDLPSQAGWCPVHLVISNQTGKRAFQCMLYLLEKGADPSIPNEDGITPMHQAASEGHVQCLKALMEAGAQLDGHDCRGHKPIDLAKLWGHRKCARILAAEQWQQDKDFLSQEMKQLQKIKLREVIEEIQADEELAADQQFYGEQAFQEWLRTRGLPPKPTGPPSAEKTRSSPKERTGSRGQMSREKTNEKSSLDHANRSQQPQGSLYHANSFRPLSNPQTPVAQPPGTADSHPERKVQEASRRNTPGSRGQEGMAYSRSTTDSGDMGLYEKPTQDQEPVTDDNMDQDQGLLHANPWNKSTKVPETFAAYMAMLQDHYPRDEYTMLPKYNPKRVSRSPTVILAEQNGSAKPRQQAKSAPANQLKRKKEHSTFLAPLKERPVVHKCKHIGDVHKRKHADQDKLPRSEIGMHMMSDMESRLFQSGLLSRRRRMPRTPHTPERIPGTASTAISGVSHWSDDMYSYRNMDLPGMLQLMKRMHAPTHFPNVEGEEYDLNLGQVAAL